MSHQIKVIANCGVKPETFTYNWSNVSPIYHRDTSIITEEGDVFFITTDGNEIYHPRNSIIKVEIERRPGWTTPSQPP